MKRNDLSTRFRRRSVPGHFMLKVEPEEIRILRAHFSSVRGNNSGERDSTRVVYRGDCVLSDHEEAVMKALFIRINRRFIAIAGRKSGIPEFWGNGNMGSESHWILLPDRQTEKKNSTVPTLEVPPKGHLRVDLDRSRGSRTRGIVFRLGKIFSAGKE